MQLPIVRQSLLEDEKDKTVESFLRQMGVAPLVAFQFIQKYLVPRYASPKDVTLEQNRSHVRFLRRAFSRMSPDELKTAISEPGSFTPYEHLTHEGLTQNLVLKMID
jgi:hypothetical protein